MLRVILNKIYDIAGALAGMFIVLIAVLILVQIVGRWFGVVVPSTEDFSGFFLAASSFLALAYSLNHSAHIRVTLLIHFLGPRQRQVSEVLVLVLASALIIYFAISSVQLVYESWDFEELSQGYVPVPLWIPQVPMALGLIILSIALLDSLVCLLRGERPSYLDDEAETESNEEIL